MKPDALAIDLRALETALRAPEVQAAYLARPAAERRRLASARTELSLLIERLDTADLNRVAAKLDELDRALKGGITDVKEKLEPLERPRSALNALARLLGLVARVVALAG